MKKEQEANLVSELENAEQAQAIEPEITRIMRCCLHLGRCRNLKLHSAIADPVGCINEM